MPKENVIADSYIKIFPLKSSVGKADVWSLCTQHRETYVASTNLQWGTTLDQALVRLDLKRL